MRRLLFITATDTGAGKTVLTSLMTRFLRERGVNAGALKPICSGDRQDARELRAAAHRALSLNEINPWHFRAPIAPLLAARREHKHIHLSEVVRHIRGMKELFDVLLVEGAGGLLSPLGENFDSGDLIAVLGAKPIIAAPNRLGVVNHVLLTLDALPRLMAMASRVVLVSPRKPDAATKTNIRLLGEFFSPDKIFTLPWLGDPVSMTSALADKRVRRMLGALTA